MCAHCLDNQNCSHTIILVLDGHHKTLYMQNFSLSRHEHWTISRWGKFLTQVLHMHTILLAYPCYMKTNVSCSQIMLGGYHDIITAQCVLL